MIVKANKDGGTTVGFSNGIISNFEPKLVFQKVEQLNMDGSKTDISYKYDEAGQLKPEYQKEFDFHIEENIEIINKQQWEDIWNEYQKSETYLDSPKGYVYPFFDWLKENYNAPEKK